VAEAPTLYHCDLTLSHVDRGIDTSLTLKVARHPSETLHRLWLRVLAYAWHCEEHLSFGPGLSDPETPDLLTRDLTGVMTRWVRVGKADPSKVQRVADQNSRAQIAVFFESPARMQSFLADAEREKCTRLDRVELVAVDPALTDALAANDARRAKLSVTIVGEHFYVERDGATFDGALTRAP
jgi:uncharacterized protein YaeQ